MTNTTPTHDSEAQEAEKVAREYVKSEWYESWPNTSGFSYDEICESEVQAHLAGQAVGEQRKQAEVERLTALLKQTEYMLLKADERGAEAERRGEERGWDAARRATNGCVISMDYSEGGGPRFVAISDWRASEEYKKGGG